MDGSRSSRSGASAAFWLVVAVVGLGCVPWGSARLVRRDLRGGTLALDGDREAAMRDAERQMSTHCGGPYTIVIEENAVVGSQQQAQADEHGTHSGSSTTMESITTDVTEYRITYVCGVVGPDGQVQPAPGPAGPPPPPTTADPAAQPPPPATAAPDEGEVPPGAAP